MSRIELGKATASALKGVKLYAICSKASVMDHERNDRCCGKRQLWTWHCLHIIQLVGKSSAKLPVARYTDTIIRSEDSKTYMKACLLRPQP